MTQEAISNWKLAGLQAEAEKAKAASSPAVAIELYTRALELAAASVEGLAFEHEFALRSGRAECYHDVANYTEEAEDLAVMLRLAHEQGDLPGQVDVLTRQVLVSANSGELEKGRQLAEEAVALAQKIGDRKLEADSHYARGFIADRLADYVRSDAAWQQAWEIYHNLGMKRKEIEVLRVRSWSARNVGQPEKAAEYAKQALILARQIKDPLSEANVLSNLTALTADHSRSRDYYEQALRIFETLGLPERLAMINNNLSLFYWGLGLFNRARVYAEKAVRFAQESQANFILANALDALGRSYLGNGMLDQARAAFEEGLQRTAEIGARREESAYQFGLGMLSLEVGQADQALDWFLKAFKNSREIGLVLDLQTPLAWAGSACLAAGRVQQALDYTAQAVKDFNDQLQHEYPSNAIWWWRYQALRSAIENRTQGVQGDPEEAWGAIERAFELTLNPIAELSDEGLRRNYMNKVPINRSITLEWARQAFKRGVSIAPL
jgi:tetratricopeptide (TPR) repeat protein